MKIFTRWSWFFLMGMPGLLQAQDKSELEDKQNLSEVFPRLNIRSYTTVPIRRTFDISDTSVTIINNGFEITTYKIDKIDVNAKLYRFHFKDKILLSAIDFMNISITQNEFESDFLVEFCKFKDKSYIIFSSFNKKVYFNQDSITDFKFNYSNFKQDLSFTDCVFNKPFTFIGNKIDGNLVFKNCKFDSIKMASNTATQITFNNCILPSKINLFDLQPSVSRISIINCKPNTTKYISLNVTGCDLNNVDMDYQNIKIAFNDSVVKPEEKRQLYLNLLENFKKKGQVESFEKLDLEYKKEFDHPLRYFIQSFWWSYGYEKNKIFRNSGIILLAFTFLTMLFYNRLQSTYKIENTNTNYGRFVNSFIYTNIIFWAFKLDITRIKFRDHIGSACYIILVYVTGIICLAYMVNYVIQS